MLPNATIYEQTYRLVRGTGYKGILDIGFRSTGVTVSTNCSMSIRGSAHFQVVVGDDGMDVIRPISPPDRAACSSQPDRTGRRWIVEDADIVSSLPSFRDRAINFTEWISGYRGIQEGAWFAA